MSSRPTSKRPASAAFAHTRPLTGNYSAPGSARPRTAQSRPGTARVATAASSRVGEGNFVIAVLESRGIGREVGVAALDRNTGTVDLIQVCFVVLYPFGVSHVCVSCHANDVYAVLD